MSMLRELVREVKADPAGRAGDECMSLIPVIHTSRTRVVIPVDLPKTRELNQPSILHQQAFAAAMPRVTVAMISTSRFVILFFSRSANLAALAALLFSVRAAEAEPNKQM